MAARGEPPLGDNELRNELKRLGFNPPPITATTRSLLVKKLEKLQEEEKKKTKLANATRIKASTSQKIFALSSDESEGETAGNSRGTTPVNASRRRSGARPAPSKTTKSKAKRLSVGPKTSQTPNARKANSRRSLPAGISNSGDASERIDQHQENIADPGSINDGFAFEKSNARNHRQSEFKAPAVPSPQAKTPRSVVGRRRSLRGERGLQTETHSPRNKEKTNTDFRGEFSDTDEDVQISHRGVESRFKAKIGQKSRTPIKVAIPTRITEKKSQRILPTPVDDENDEEEEEEEEDDSEKKETFSVDSAKEESGRWSFLSRRRTTPQRPEEQSASHEQEDDGNSTGNWTFFTSRFNSSRTSTPRKFNRSDDTIYHSIAGNSTRQDVSVNAVATPVSGRTPARDSTLDATRTNHASFHAETPSVGSSAPKQQEQTPNRSFIMNDDAQTTLKEQAVDEAQVFATEENLGSSWRTKYGHFVSRLLLGSVFLFFILLALMYLSVNSTERAAHLQIADLAGGDDVDYSGDEMPLQMVQALHVKLSQMSGDYLCGKFVLKNMSLEEAKIFLQEDVTLGLKQRGKPFWVAENLPRTLQLITENPHWGLNLYKEDGEPITDYDYSDGVAWLDSSRAHLNLYCKVKTTALNILFWMSFVMTAIAIIWPVFLLFKYQKRRKEKEQQAVTQLVEKIIEVLANHQQACYNDRSLTPYLAIPHVRDTLIPPAERHKKQKLWEKAVQFLNVNESRVRVETQQVAGEEFAVWRWVQPSPAVAVTSFSPITERDMNPKRTKVWQGTAFANLDTAVKASAYSFTQCLKVRNMFDPTLESGNNWHMTIQDAILERCGENSGIVHVAVDKNSREGCVYVKCVSPEMAGMAFRCLQGSWFDGRLVTVKYIRLDRYHQRFPSALSVSSLLKPSNDLRTSLQPLPASSS